MTTSKQRSLSLLDVTCIGVNAIVGSSVFLFPGKLADILGPSSILAFALTGFLLITVGLCYAEAATYYEATGGPYLYAKDSFGDWPGFGIGWMTWIAQMFSWAAVANAIAVYLGYFGPQYGSTLIIKITAGAVILVMGALNYRGVKLAAWTSNFFTAAKLIPLAIFIIIGLPQVQAINYQPFAPTGFAPMGKACFLAYFAFQGFEYIPVPAGEMKNPSRNVPIAIISALIFASGLYMLVQAVAVGVHPALASSERPLADAAALVLGPWGAGLMVLGAVISTTGYNSSVALVTPRYLIALANDGHIPSILKKIHPQYGTPHMCVLLTTGLTLFMALALDFNKLVDFTNIVVCVQYIATCVAVPILRRFKTAAPGSFRLPGGWTVPIVGTAATLWLGAQGDIEQVKWSFVLLGSGFVVKFLCRAR